MRPALHLIVSVMLGLASTVSLIAPSRVGPWIDDLMPGAVRNVAAAHVNTAKRLDVLPPAPGSRSDFRCSILMCVARSRRC